MNHITSYGFNWKTIFTILVFAFAILLLLPAPNFNLEFLPNQANVALIDVSGTITDSGGNLLTDGVSPDTIRSLTKKAEERNMDAIVYSINSPGGSVVASREIKRTIETSKVPTVCQYKDVVASGALWVSMGCDKIVSDSLTVTGSIGATSSYLEYSGLLEKLGIEYVNITSGRFKSTGSPYKNITEEEREFLEENLDEVKNTFLDKIRKSRDLEMGDLENVSDGRIFLGKEAKDIGLVDELGGVNTVKNVLKEELDVEKVNIRKITPSNNFNILSQIFARIGYGIGSSLRENTNRGIVSIKR